MFGHLLIGQFKKSILLFVLMLVTTLVVACGGGETTSGDPESSGNEGGNTEEDKPTLVIGTDAAYPPFESLDPATNEIVGFDVDLIGAVLEEAGYDYEITNTGWDPLFMSLENDDIDLGISAITIDPSRQESYDFTTPYFESAQMMLFTEGTEIETALDLEGKKIGVQSGTTGQFATENVLEELGYSTTEIDEAISHYDSTPVAIMAVTAGELDVAVIDNTVAEEYVKKNPDSELIAIGDPENFDPEFYGIIFKKDNPLRDEVNTALKTIIENGTYAEIFNEWFGYEPDVDTLLNAE
ncbi:basic amino acid ABC transporter substrate-binding protein [Caldalkalibacillus salinus]|uniref:basic amino acid ABC transporter substrate-binding protein n=1 Tax=Caldalkalibacillus salinus TaxID=2803787 RepID=UPI001F43ABEF|nr:basic amino acid ABC transporter substrate-binding protein [Caldalkalibacillus salinus]